MSRLLIMGGNDTFVTRINVLPGTQVMALSRETIASGKFDSIRSIDPQSLPDLIFLGETIPFTVTLEIARASDEHYPMIDLVLVGNYESDAIMEAMHAGIRDVISADVPESRLIELIRRAENHRAKGEGSAPAVTASAVQPEHSRTIAVISPKGGVGKTSIATNLAIGLAEKYPMDVVIVDLDLQFGDVASALNLTPSSTMEDALGRSASADTLVLKTLLSVHNSDLYVLPGAESPAAIDTVTDQQIKRLLEQLSTQFRFIIIDTSAGLSEATLAALEMTDDAILVSTMDVSCVRGVRKEIELLAELGLLPASRVLALNLADRQSGMKVRDVEAVVGLAVDVVIPRSDDVQLAGNRGEPLILKKKKSGPFVKAIYALIEKLEGRGPMESKTRRRLEVA